MKRSAEACTICRSRKVRCDVVESLPCSNCKWHGVRCTIQENRRRKKRKFSGQREPQRHEPVSPDDESGGKSPSFNQTGDQSSSVILCEADAPVGLELPLDEQTVLERSSLDQPACASKDIEQSFEYPTPDTIFQNEAIDTELCASRKPSHPPTPTNINLNSFSLQKASQSADLGHLADILKNYSPAGLQTNNSGNALFHCDTSYAPTVGTTLSNPFEAFISTPYAQNCGETTRLPSFIEWDVTKLPTVDASFLYQKGVLTLPSASLQCALLRAYITFVHPEFPVLDLPEFLHKITSKGQSVGHLSLLLYYAVLFASIPYVDIHFLQKSGFASRASARESFNDKIRLLCDFNYEDDSLIQIQALLLQAHAKDTPGDYRDDWHLTGAAISVALSIGLHKSPKDSIQSPCKQRLSKRLWWMCFLSDHLLALLTGRPIRILHEDHEISMLDENDFDLGPFPVDGYIITSNSHHESSPSTIRKHAILCIAKVDLFLSIFQTSKVQYATNSRHRAGPQITSVEDTDLLKQQINDLRSLFTADLPLLRWSVASRPFYLCTELSGPDVDRGQEYVAVQAIFLQMVHLFALSTLQRSLCQRFLQWPYSNISESVQELFRIKVRDAASQVGRLAAQLCGSNSARYLPVHVIKLVASAAIELDSNSNRISRHGNDKDIQGIQNCVKLLTKLSGIYQAADKTLEMLCDKFDGAYGFEGVLECSEPSTTATLSIDEMQSSVKNDTSPIAFESSDPAYSEIYSLEPLASLSWELLTPITVGDQEYHCPQFEVTFDNEHYDDIYFDGNEV